MFWDALTTASRLFAHPTLLPRLSNPFIYPTLLPRLSNPFIYPTLLPRLSNPFIYPTLSHDPSLSMVVHFLTFDSFIAASSFSIGAPLRMKGGWLAKTNGRAAGMSRSLCSYLAYAIIQSMQLFSLCKYLVYASI